MSSSDKSAGDRSTTATKSSNAETFRVMPLQVSAHVCNSTNYVRLKATIIRAHSSFADLRRVGDYASKPDDFKFDNCSATHIPSYQDVWGENVRTIKLHSTKFTLDGKFLLNHDTKQFVNLNEYKAASIDEDG